MRLNQTKEGRRGLPDNASNGRGKGTGQGNKTSHNAAAEEAGERITRSLVFLDHKVGGGVC